jgi:flavin reductase (DIM6/NTAB) family NADH-FMN oxidoreductase RutF
VRTDFDPTTMPTTRFYRLLTAVVVPRPIAWVSSTSATGVDNLAPHSFFNVACQSPPIVQFTSVGRKDTQRNVEATGEFVVNFAAEPEVGLLRPLCRLGRNEWGTIDEVMRMRRVPYAEWPGTPDNS